MALYTRCDCFWSVETGKIASTDPKCPIHGDRDE